MRQPRVLVILHSSLRTSGGAENATAQFVAQWRQSDVDVATLTYDDLPGWLPWRLQRPAFPYLVAWRLISDRAHTRYDVIDSSTGDTWLYATLSRRRPFIVVRSHGLEPLGERAIRRQAAASGVRLGWFRDLYYRWWMPWEVRRSLRQADLVRVLNDAEREYCESELRLSRERVVVRPNGRPVDRDDRHVDPAPPASAVAIGRWEPMKGAADLTRVMTRVMRDRAEFRLTLLGTGVSAPQVLADFPRELGDRITVVPRYEPGEVAELLRGHTFYLSASHSEGFSLGLVEAMAAGAVPVVSRVGAAPDLIEEAGCGALFAAGDVAACIAALDAFLGRPEDWSRLSRRARDRVSGLSWDTVARRDLEIYVERMAATQPGSLSSGSTQPDGVSVPPPRRANDGRRRRSAAAVQRSAEER